MISFIVFVLCPIDILTITNGDSLTKQQRNIIQQGATTDHSPGTQLHFQNNFCSKSILYFHETVFTHGVIQSNASFPPAPEIQKYQSKILRGKMLH